MDANPWTYRISALEMIREGKVSEGTGKKADGQIEDPRHYLYLELAKETTPANTDSKSWIGTAVSVKIIGDPHWYTSHLGDPMRSTQRDGRPPPRCFCRRERRRSRWRRSKYSPFRLGSQSLHIVLRFAVFTGHSSLARTFSRSRPLSNGRVR
ncbi:hypothetical protein PAECIP111802_03692 [Paenibacillus allorhizosphaerae]|uniref:Uncharacterized protein n=1 Tax=Paenibacillus allorhizosphaerae TaxID=2849866 RepID=A0ABM8VK44_9BACL|nr:hypothetical protein PAECIP111802_03692 [Paenibacillus allorhizosphaerae]